MYTEDYEKLYEVIKNGAICSVLDAIAHMYGTLEIRRVAIGPMSQEEKDIISKKLYELSENLRRDPFWSSKPRVVSKHEQ